MSIGDKVREHSGTMLGQLNFSQRVLNLKILPEPNAVRLTFDTKFPSLPAYSIFDYATGPDGKIAQTTPAIKSGFDFVSALLGKSFKRHDIRIGGLQQDRDYSFRITAATAKSNAPAAVIVGSFTTGKRTARYTVSEIFLWNDGDPGLGGAGELWFYLDFYRAGTRLGSVLHRGDYDAGVLVKRPFGNKPAFTDPSASDVVGLVSHVAEFDQYFYPGAGLQLVGYEAPEYFPGEVGHGEDDDHVWADAKQEITLPNVVGERDLPYQLDSGPWGVHYWIRGIVRVNVTAPAKLPWSPLMASAWIRAARVVTLDVGGLGKMHDGGKSLWAGLGPSGEIAWSGDGVSNWQLLDGPPADRAWLISGERGDVDILVMAGGTLHHARVDRGFALKSRWRGIGEHFSGPVAVGLRDGLVHVAALDIKGRILTASVGEKVEWSSAGEGHRDVKLLASEHAIEVFVLGRDGEVRTRHWNDDRWIELKGPAFVEIAVASDKAGRYVLGVTHRREAHLLVGADTVWRPDWHPVGTIDALDGDVQRR